MIGIARHHPWHVPIIHRRSHGLAGDVAWLAISRPLSPGSLHEFKQESDQLLRLFNAFEPVGGKLSAKERRRCQVMLPDIISKLKELQDGLSGFIVKLKDVCE